MQITKRFIGEMVELKVEGRLDVYWADHLAAAVGQEIRQGSHHIQLDLAQVAFLSSAGIGVLVRFYRELKSIQGSFAVSNCSRNVLKILELSHLDKMLVAPALPASLRVDELEQTSTAGATTPPSITQMQRSGVMYEIYPLASDSDLECRRLGDP